MICSGFTPGGCPQEAGGTKQRKKITKYFFINTSEGRSHENSFPIPGQSRYPWFGPLTLLVFLAEDGAVESLLFLPIYGFPIYGMAGGIFPEITL